MRLLYWSMTGFRVASGFPPTPSSSPLASEGTSVSSECPPQEAGGLEKSIGA
eukprot:CAMPEP_0184493166 /NCGR_PEP_ID=MMETSP0113_2-20130426/25286_1 /TAXON_ID=91329 /ORGANISM="Norrisiella sphaerica, Strain BC52" /LENGTH=51 /DNA_ID=CAMNT_0026878337 /DNA_START=1210 /DNA_END=1361 /DNA_ORIENTATION=-